jgi:hypothetical protein
MRGVRAVGLEIARQKKAGRRQSWIFSIWTVLVIAIWVFALWPHKHQVLQIQIHYSQPVVDPASLRTI